MCVFVCVCMCVCVCVAYVCMRMFVGSDEGARGEAKGEDSVRVGAKIKVGTGEEEGESLGAYVDDRTGTVMV